MYVCSGSWLWQDCIDAQAHLSICCLHMQQEPKSHLMTHVENTTLNRTEQNRRTCHDVKKFDQWDACGLRTEHADTPIPNYDWVQL